MRNPGIGRPVGRVATWAWLWAVVLVLAAGGGAARAADVQVDATVDETTIPIDGQLVYTITVTGGARNMPQPELPSLGADWSVYNGGTSRNFSFVNGQVSSSASFRYVLTPKRPGQLTIGKASLKIGSTVYVTEPIVITVTASAGGGAPPGAGGRAGSAGADRQASEEGDKDLFVTASVDTREPYVQQQVILSVRFYQRIQLLEQPSYQAPSTTGFWSEDLPPQRTYYEVINGRRYYVTEIRRALFPTTAGDATIGPARVECLVPDTRGAMSNDPFGFFGRSVVGSKPVTIQSRPITIQVRPLPAGAPAGFAGAVGSYRLTAAVDRASAAQGDPVTLSLEISGTGNLKTVPDPQLPALPEFKVYDSTSSSDLRADGDLIRGSRTSQILLVPLKAGTLTIPPITLAWFDTKAGQYRTARSEPIAVSVTPGAVTAGGGVAGSGRGAIEVTGQDIRFIRTELGPVSARGRRIWDGPLFWLFQLLPVGVFVGSVLHDRRQRRLAGDVGLARGLRSGREAVRRLKRARQLADAGDAGFHAELAGALRGYVADKFNRSAAGLTLEEIDSLLSSRRIPPGLVGDIRQTLEECDMARFAPVGGGAADRERLLTGAARILDELKRGGL